MGRSLVAWCVLVLAGLASAAAGAQERAGPVVFLQPGMLTGDFLSAPATEPSTTGFNMRAMATIPSRTRWLTLYLGASVTPYGTTGASRRNTNTPMLFIGNLFPVVGTNRTAGWLTVDVPVVLTYTFGGGGDRNGRVYGKDVAVEVLSTIPVGPKLLSGFGGPLARLRVYGVFHQSLTPNLALDGTRDRFNPLAFYGLSLPFGTGGDSP
ncbi:MAG: hypothetical protein IPK85_06450 [Gemmatimonadetes bacterium]|nr:hypothetical protein [Gemmatimonadota bacterium]